MKCYTICSVQVKASNEHFAIGLHRLELSIELFRVEQCETENLETRDESSIVKFCNSDSESSSSNMVRRHRFTNARTLIFVSA